MQIISRDVKMISPFTRDNGNQIRHMTSQYLDETRNNYKDDRYEYLLDYGAHTLPQWVRIFMHGYFNKMTLVEAHHDFRKQVYLLYLTIKVMEYE